MGTSAKTWYRDEDPVEPLQVLAQVRRGNEGAWMVLEWTGAVFVKDGLSTVSRSDVLRYRLLEPLLIEKDDKRRPEITEVVEYFKTARESIGGVLDGNKFAREQCKVLLDNKVAIKYPDYKADEIAKLIIYRIVNHPKLKKEVTSFTYLNNNFDWITNKLEDERRKPARDKAASVFAKLGGDAGK